MPRASCLLFGGLANLIKTPYSPTIMFSTGQLRFALSASLLLAGLLLRARAR